MSSACPALAEPECGMRLVRADVCSTPDLSVADEDYSITAVQDAVQGPLDSFHAPADTHRGGCRGVGQEGRTMARSWS